MTNQPRVNNKEILNQYVSTLKKGLDFKGRASRREFMIFAFFNISIAIMLLIADKLLINQLLGLVSTELSVDGLLINIFSLIITIPSLALSVRRLHDTGNKGQLLLIPSLISIIGVIIGVFLSKYGGSAGGFISTILYFIASLYLLFQLLSKGDKGTNEYGAPPIEIAYKKGRIESIVMAFFRCFFIIANPGILAFAVALISYAFISETQFLYKSDVTELTKYSASTLLYVLVSIYFIVMAFKNFTTSEEKIANTIERI